MYNILYLTETELGLALGLRYNSYYIYIYIYIFMSELSQSWCMGSGHETHSHTVASYIRLATIHDD